MSSEGHMACEGLLRAFSQTSSLAGHMAHVATQGHVSSHRQHDSSVDIETELGKGPLSFHRQHDSSIDIETELDPEPFWELLLILQL